MFQIGDKIVHPMHGAGIIDYITTQRINGVTREYYVLKLPVGGILVMVPTANCEEIGVRPVMNSAEVDRVLAGMRELKVEHDSNWNRRYRENMAKLKSGDLTEVARVMKSLMVREAEKGLSTGERKMLHSARQILFSEAILSGIGTYDEIENRISAALTQ